MLTQIKPSALHRGSPSTSAPQNRNLLMFSDITPLVGGKDLSGMKKVWEEVAICEARLNLLVQLREKSLGYNEIEKFKLGLKYSLKSSKMKELGTKPVMKVVKAAMDLKMKDEMMNEKELKRKRERMRRGKRKRK